MYSKHNSTFAFFVFYFNPILTGDWGGYVATATLCFTHDAFKHGKL